MYIKLPSDYVDPATLTPLPDAVLTAGNVEVSSRAGDVRITAIVHAAAALIDRAPPLSESVLAALSVSEIASISPSLLKALYEVLLDRPGFEGAELITEEGDIT